MMKIVILFALAAAVFAAAPEASFVQEGSEPVDPTYESATTHVESMLEEDTMARRSACVKAADASINGVFRDVKNAQRMLNRLDNGRACATRNQHLINRAKRTIKTRQAQVRSSVNYQRKMRRSRVKWNFSFESLREGSCAAFYRSGQWQGAKRRVHHANRRLTGARANLRAAHNNLKVQIRNAKRVRNQCRCRVQARTARALKTAKRLTGDRMKTLLREMMVKCLVAARRHGKNANKVAARCKNLRVSAGYKRRLRLFRTRLAPGVAAARCGAVGWSVKRKVICHQKYWHVSHKSLDQCKALCNKTPGCRANGFSYVSQWRQCRLPRANVPCKAWHYHIGAFYRKVVRKVARKIGGRAPRAGFSQRMHKTSRNKPACKAMRAFRNRLSNSKTYRKIVVRSHGKGGYTCNNAGIATKICRAIKLANKRVTLKVKCGGVTWAVGQCGAANGKKAMELNVAVKNNGNICQCQNKGFTLRPCIGHTNSNWGGFGNSCGGKVSQTMQVSCQ